MLSFIYTIFRFQISFNFVFNVHFSRVIIVSHCTLFFYFQIDDIRIRRRPWDERLHSMIARLKRGTFSKNTNKHWLVKAESLQNDRNQQKTARFKSWNLTGKLKGYLFQKTKLWEELVALTAKVKKPRSQKKKQEVCNQENVILCQNVNTRILFIQF